MDNEIEEFAKFINLEEKLRLKVDDEDDDEVEMQPSVIPIDTGSSVNTSATTDILKRGRATLTAPKAKKSSLDPTIARFVGAESNPISMAAYTGRNISLGGTSTPMPRMPIAASYEPFKNINDEILNENMLKMKRRINALLNKEPHKTEVNNMRKELEM